MPHTSHRKKQSRPKRAHVADEDGWTRVTTTNLDSRQPRPSTPGSTTKEGISSAFGYTTATPVEGLTLEKLQNRFQEIEKKWLESESWRTLCSVLEYKIARTVIETVRDAAVFGTGSYSGMRNGWVERSEVSLYQLAAFKTAVDTIERMTDHRPPMRAQDPVYNDIDTQLLASLGIEKVDHPVGFKGLSCNSFIYAPNSELSVELSCMEANPGIAMFNSKLDHHWRNEKGQACTNRVFYFTSLSDDSNSDPDLSNMTNIPPTSDVQDRLEKQLQTMEKFLHDKEAFVLPDLDVRDFPFSNVYVHSKKADNEDEVS